MMKVDDAESPNIKLLCATRWTVRAEALKSISENYAAVLELWDWSLESGNVNDSDMKARIIGIQTEWSNLTFIMAFSSASAF